MKSYYSISVFLLTSFFSCQKGTLYDIDDLKDPNFDSVYVETATSVAAEDLDKALFLADSLLLKSENIYQEMKAFMLLATLHLRSGKEDKSLAYAEQAADLASKGMFTHWQVRIAGFLSTTYRSVGLTTEARRYLKKAEILNAGLKDTGSYFSTQLMIHQERAYFLMEEEKNYNAALEELEEAQKIWTYIYTSPQEKNRFKATIYQMMGECYLHLDELILAEKMLRESLRIMESHPSGLLPFIWRLLGDLEVKRKNYKEGLDNYLIAGKEIKNSNNFNAQISLEASLMNYYAEIGNEKVELLHRTQYLELLKRKVEHTKAISNAVIDLLNESKLQENDKRPPFLYSVIGLLSILTFLAVVLYSRRQKKKSIIVQTSLSTSRKDISKETNKVAIAKETEDHLLAMIEDLEIKEFYLEEKMSLAILASKLDTNTKYIAYIVNKYKGKDFKTYVNELRVKKFLEDSLDKPKILNYKFSYIAQQYGFASHRSFSNAFKEHMQLSPSEYVNHLKEKEEV